MKPLSAITNPFPLWVLAGSLAALAHPPLFTWFSGRLIPLGPGVIMLGMGLTLEIEDVTRGSSGCGWSSLVWFFNTPGCRVWAGRFARW